MRINHNIAALNTHRQLGQANQANQNSMEKLSSGLRINNASDDAAGLAISEKMRGQIRGLEQAQTNAQDGISMIQTAEGALNETHSILQRMRELSVQSSNDTNTADDRAEIQKEVEQLKSEIDRVSDTTEFNTQKLLNGSLGAEGSSDNTSVAELESASGLKEGDYNLEVTQEATVKTAGDGSATFDGIVDNSLSSADLSVNGVKIDFSDLANDADLAAVTAKINEFSDQTGVVAAEGATNQVSLSTEQFGSNAELTLTGAQAGIFGNQSSISGGDDATVEITNEDGVMTEVTGNGKAINYGSAELNIADTTGTGTATISVESTGASFQIGSNKDQNMLIDINEMSTKTLGNKDDGLVKDIDVRTQNGANDAIKALDAAIQEVSGERSKLGAFQNRLDHTINNLGTSSENLTAAESRIRDVDMAKEMMNQTKQSILAQASQAMLAKANQQPQGVLQLLR